MIAGDARMVCDPSTPDSTRYIKAECDSRDFGYPDEGDKNAKAVCEKVNGKFCGNNCFFNTLSSNEDSARRQFADICNTIKNPDGSHYQDFVLVYPTKTLIQDSLYYKNCKDQIPDA